MNSNGVTSSKSSSNLPAHPSNMPGMKFDYSQMDTESRAIIERHTNEIKGLMRRTTQAIIEIGEKLIDVKAQLGHGNFIIWLKAEFDWSIPTANRFMRVAENFKSVNLMHLNIATSALYVLASPSTPEGAREEVLERAHSGQNITYTKAKAIVSEFKKAALHEPKKLVSFDVDGNSTKPIEQKENQTSGVQDILVDWTRKEIQTTTSWLQPQDLEPYSRSKNEPILPTFERKREQFEDETTTSIVAETETAIEQKISDIIITEIESKIKCLPPEHLAHLTLIIINSAKNKLTKCQLEAIITAVKQAMN
ncbi:MAG: DUF3102 domain-containing protein [Stigonema ocellatum SAG 48.90 = DSM 106950]|nr:DUF3102 domain-containing protein [Stigonema ocellatum SAG 48.90 = DSM 106950]